MVLCKFFQQGSCRFGSKCVNEHFDVKQVIKTDVEGAINGKQWPLSTYGPFKDKPSLHNFIEDRSFEEVRMICYEAKQKNFFDQFHQQFNKEASEARNKMKALLQMTPDIIDAVISVYDMPSHKSGGGGTVCKPNNTSNPFGLGNSATNTCSIFAKPTTNAPTNLFGNNSTFGTTTQASTGLFGPQQQQHTSMFSQSSNSLFSGINNTNSQQITSIFGEHAKPSIFSTSNQQQHQQQQGQSGMFGQQNQFTQQQVQQNSNIFGQPSQTTQPQQGLFAQAAQQTTSGQSMFSQVPQQTQNIFGQAMLQQQQINPNKFQQNPTANTGQQHQINVDLFQQTQYQQHQVQNQQPPTGVFQQAGLQTQNVSQMNHLSNAASSTAYTRLEDLTTDEIEAFKADCFLPGKIPFNPPPRELIN